MEYLRLLYEANKPKNRLGQIKLLSVLGFGLAALSFIPLYIHHRYAVEPYKTTVCWDHYKMFIKDYYVTEDIESKRSNEYLDCIFSARNRRPITPVTLD